MQLAWCCSSEDVGLVAGGLLLPTSVDEVTTCDDSSAMKSSRDVTTRASLAGVWHNYHWWDPPDDNIGSKQVAEVSRRRPSSPNRSKPQCVASCTRRLHCGRFDILNLNSNRFCVYDGAHAIGAAALNILATLHACSRAPWHEE